MTVALSSWRPFIQMPMVPLPAIEQAVLDAAIRFCEGSHIWKHTLDRINVVGDQAGYSLSLSTAMAAYARIIGVAAAWYKQDGEEDSSFTRLDPLSADHEDRVQYDAWHLDSSSTPSNYYVNASDPTTLYLYPIPEDDSDEGLLVKVCLRPIEGATVLPDILYNQYRRQIATGARAYLYGTPGMPWSNPNKANELEIVFDEMIAAANLVAMKGLTHQELTVQFRGDSWL
ncbi:MAG TPA: hypothetical protein ENG73_07440 [Desulfobacterales bacterium]|nr:hypothetical protein [Desulfobacterales bacterium]